MYEDWIILAKFTKLPEANECADILKEEGIDCHIIFGEPEKAFTLGEDRHPWIYLEVLEADFDEAADILDLEPIHYNDINDFYENPGRETRRRDNLLLWGGIFGGIALLRILADVLN